MKKINLKNIFKKKLSSDNKPMMAWPINHIRDWKWAVSFFAVILIILSIFSWQIYLSNKIAGGYLEPESLPADITVRTINKNQLQDILLLLDTKQTDFLLNKATQAKLIDPSL